MTLGGLRQDLRLAFRKLRLDPGLSAISVVALSLGIGLTGTMFSTTYAALFRGLPFDEPDELVQWVQVRPNWAFPSSGIPFHDYLDIAAEQSSFEGVAAYTREWADLSDDADYPARVAGAGVEPALFDLLGVRPLLGRVFSAEETGADRARVLLLGYDLWQERYGGDAGIVGSVVRLDGANWTVVGVMPEGFAFPDQQEFWAPLAADTREIQRGRLWVEAMGRLRDDVDLGRARQELRILGERLAREYPETNAEVGFSAETVMAMTFGDEEYSFIWSMMGAGVFVLLIACANVANLLLARATDRGKEVAIRAALGAGRRRILSQLLTEALALAVVGGLGGVALTFAGVAWFRRALVTVDMPFWLDVRVDLPIVFFLAAISVVTALLAGVVPGWKAAGVSFNEILKDESRGASGLRMGRASRVMVVGGIALSFPLLVAAGLMIASVGRFNADPGFATREVLTAAMGLPFREYPEAEDRRRFWGGLVERAEGLPGVRAAAFASSLPGVYTGSVRFEMEGVEYLRPEDMPRARHVFVGPGFFETLGAEALRGRTFTDGDRADALPVALVNASFARRYFPDTDPLGRRIRVCCFEDAPWRTVVGVVPDMRLNGADREMPEGLYRPVAQSAPTYGFLLARSSSDPLALTSSVRSEVGAMDPHLPLRDVATLETRMERSAWFVNVFGTVFTFFGAVALFLAAVGLYGVMSFSVVQRTREVGVRMAFGAEAGSVLRLMLGKGMSQVAVGLAVGLILAFFVSRFLTITLYMVEPRDPVTFGLVALVLFLAGLLACLVPALRATRLDPVDALRYG
jgi:predicted permease